MQSFRTRHVAMSVAIFALALVAAACSATGSHPKAVEPTPSVVSSTTSSTATSTTIAHTEVTIFNPFTPNGPGPGVVVTFHTTAQCNPGSEGDGTRADAYRCFLDKAEPDGANIEDPCFTNPFTFSAPLLCFVSPL